MASRFLISLCFLWLQFVAVTKLHAQKAVVSNTNLNILYAGLENRLDILLDGVLKENIEVSCKDFKVLDSLGFYYVYIDKNCKLKETKFYVRDRNKRNKVWADSVAFRIKKIPTPVAQLGTLTPGSAYQNGELSMQKRCMLTSNVLCMME
jgi:hypothetical protein